MAVSVTVLGSGSKGNSTVISSDRTRILVDAGFSCRETFRRMRISGFDPESLTAVVITHEHMDHVSGVYMLSRKLRIPVFMTEGTHHAWKQAVRSKIEGPVKLEKYESFFAGHKFQIGDVEVMPFTVPHDAADPVGFRFRVDGVRIGVVTDLGYIPPSVMAHIRGCDCLMIESNHDLEMLRSGPYPWAVKQRVLSRVGHLSNAALAEFFEKDYDGAAVFLLLAHLSEQNNHPEIARNVAEQALGAHRGSRKLMLASQHQPLQSIRL